MSTKLKEMTDLVNPFKVALDNNKTYNKRLKDNDDVLYYRKFFEKIFYGIEYIYLGEDNRILCVADAGISIWDRINNTLFFNMFYSSENEDYDVIKEKYIGEYQ